MIMSIISWLSIGFVFNYISTMLLNEDISNPNAPIICVLLCWIGPFAIMNVLGLLLLNLLDTIYFSKTFEKVRNKYFMYIYDI